MKFDYFWQILLVLETNYWMICGCRKKIEGNSFFVFEFENAFQEEKVKTLLRIIISVLLTWKLIPFADSRLLMLWKNSLEQFSPSFFSEKRIFFAFSWPLFTFSFLLFWILFGENSAFYHRKERQIQNELKEKMTNGNFTVLEWNFHYQLWMLEFMI